MTPRFSKAVDPVFLHVLGLLERIGRGEQPSPKDERLWIRGLIDQAEGQLGQGIEWQLAKYALVAWIDDVLIEAPWEGRSWWKENALEVEIFNTRLRNEQFYVKARDSSSLAQKDALEVFYVSVVLGFRGLYRDPAAAAALASPDNCLRTWRPGPSRRPWPFSSARAVRRSRMRVGRSKAPALGRPAHGPVVRVPGGHPGHLHRDPGVAVRGVSGVVRTL